jgi:VanZ family protein
MYKLAGVIAVGFFLFIVWIIYLANTGGGSVFFDFVRVLPYGDKLGHAGLFGFLTLVTIVALKYRCLQLGKLRIYSGVVAVVLFVVCEEISQVFISSRTFDFTDLTADMAGILLAAVVAFMVRKHLTKSSSKDAARGAA